MNCPEILARERQTARDLSDRVESFLPLVVARAHRVWSCLPGKAKSQVQMCELVSAGLVGAWRAVRFIDGPRGAEVRCVSKLAAVYIRNAMVDWLRSAGYWRTGSGSPGSKDRSWALRVPRYQRESSYDVGHRRRYLVGSQLPPHVIVSVAEDAGLSAMSVCL